MITRTTVRGPRTIIHLSSYRMTLEGLAPSHDITRSIALAESQCRDVKIDNGHEMLYITPAQAVKLLKAHLEMGS